VNIAKTHSPDIFGDAAVEDFATSFRTLAPYADFVVVNVSFPNTKEGKTFEDPAVLGELMEALARERRALGANAGPAVALPPVLVKLSAPRDTPEGRERLAEMLRVLQASELVEGLVLSNTFPDREVQLSDMSREASAAIGKGGLSGKPIRDRSTAAIRTAYQLTGGRLPIIGVGGVDSAEAAYEKIRAGASLVEVYTGLAYNGPGLLEDMHVGLRRLLEKDGFASISEAVGADTAKRATA